MHRRTCTLGLGLLAALTLLPWRTGQAATCGAVLLHERLGPAVLQGIPLGGTTVVRIWEAGSGGTNFISNPCSIGCASLTTAPGCSETSECVAVTGLNWLNAGTCSAAGRRPARTVILLERTTASSGGVWAAVNLDKNTQDANLDLDAKADATCGGGCTSQASPYVGGQDQVVQVTSAEVTSGVLTLGLAWAAPPAAAQALNNSGASLVKSYAIYYRRAPQSTPPAATGDKTDWTRVNDGDTTQIGGYSLNTSATVSITLGTSTDDLYIALAPNFDGTGDPSSDTNTKSSQYLSKPVLVYGPNGTPPNPVQFFTARATSGTTLLEWQNPAAGSYGAGVVRVRTDGTFPTSVSDGVGVTCGGQDTALSGYNSCTHTGVNGTAYSYSLFVDNGTGVTSSRKTVAATPFDTTGARKWAYSTGAASLAPTGIRPGAVAVGAVYDVANDRVLHAMNPTGAGGSWPRTAPYGWMPLAMNAPAQHRPSIVPLAAGPRVFLASQDGYAYAVNAQTGALVWTSPLLGDVLQANPAGLFSDLVPTAPNLLFVGTRNSTSANTLYALNPNTGAVVTTFNNGGGATAIGIITGLAVDYTTNLVYFTSRAAGGGSSDTVWCLSTTGGVLVKVWSAAVGDIDGAPIPYNGRLYLGTNSGQVLAVDAATHATVWTYPTGDGPVKGFVTPAFGTSPLRLYLATTATVWALNDLGGAASLAWSNAALPSPSTPLVLFGTTSVLIGAGNGTLYQLGTVSGAVTGSVSLGSTALGSPSFDVTNSLAHVGSTAGVVHAVVVPLP